MSQPRYTAIKDHILHNIESRQWRAGDRVPSENVLADEFQVSRMTARRALQELGEQGILVRTQGLGSFVADSRPMSSMLAINSIDREIAERGHRHRAEVLLLESARAGRGTAALLGLAVGDPAFHSVLVHHENDIPLQWEERWVNPRFGPDYLEQDFRAQTPSHYLSSISPLTEADQTVEAIRPTPSVVNALNIDEDEPCLQLKRRTWCKRGIVNIATLIYPGSRYRIGGHLNF